MPLRLGWILMVPFLGCAGERQASPAATPPASELKSPTVIGYGTLQGVVTYNGDEEPRVEMIKPYKDEKKCPPQVPGRGWYVNEKTKGVHYAVVFLRPPPRYRMPPTSPEAVELPRDSAGEVQEEQLLRAPRAQFEPRVLCLHPKQKLKTVNDGLFNFEVYIVGRDYSTVYMLTYEDSPKHAVKVDLKPSDTQPYRVTSGIHGWMSAYVWKMTHPNAQVTDADGKFELKDVPVLADSQKLVLYVWHEMLPGDHFKEIGPLELETGKTNTRNFGIPK